MSQKLITVR